MKIATGKVLGGKVVVEGAPLEEGTSVTVLARNAEPGFTLTEEEEVSTPNTADPVLWSLAAVGTILLGFGIFVLHRQIARRIDQIGSL